MADGLCWCASDTKCPHGISSKIPVLWEDMELIIDEVLQKYDRKTIRKFLKKDVDGKAKITASTPIIEAYKADGIKPMGKKTSKGSKRPVSPFSKSTPLPLPAAQTNFVDLHTSTISSSPQRPITGQFSRDLLSHSMPGLPPRITSDQLERNKPTTVHDSSSSFGRRTPMQAWTSTATEPPQSHSNPAVTSASEIPSFAEVPGETTISAGLMRIADCLARRVLPWQAVLCPRAVETLHDLRQTMIHTKHTAFVNQMKQKLEDKVMGFMRKKEEEVEIWLEAEVKNWQKFMQQDDEDLQMFIREDLKRIDNRMKQQEIAYRRRELKMATEFDDHERDSTREQLINFRRICRAKSGNDEKNKKEKKGKEPEKMEVRQLQDTIASAQSAMQKKINVTSRDMIRKVEESHDWLCSLADNAIIAGEGEAILKRLYAALDEEKGRTVESLQTALSTYREQHNSILEAIVVFAGRIHQHASDYLQREQLVSRAFLQYLMSIISGEIKSHTTEHKKNTYAWENKSMYDRSKRKEQALVQDFHLNIGPLDKLTAEFKDRMRVQLDHITLKLQSVLNGRENDVAARKTQIHKKLARHVNKACNSRRQKLKDATAARRDEFELEGRCISRVEQLTNHLRSAVDQLWVKEHLKERRIHEAAFGRMERLEKSALIIWNKHSHLAIGQKEEYEDWLNMHVRERNVTMSKRKYQIRREWMEWRSHFGVDVKGLSSRVITDVSGFVSDSYVYNLEDTVEKNLEDVKKHNDVVKNNFNSHLNQLREKLGKYLSNAMSDTDVFADKRKQALLLEWQENLYLLNNAINRRVGGLKDMEADLEETIRMTIMQHEVENAVFEQLSCARFEMFWLEWRGKMQEVARDLREELQDYRAAKQAGKSKKSKKREQELMQLAKDRKEPLPDIGGKSPTKAILDTGGDGADLTVFNPNELYADVDNSITDTMRFQAILDGVRPEVYRGFMHKLTRGIEKIRKALGEGRNQLVPPYAVAKVLIASCDAFWDKAKLAERCVGRVSSRGVLLFQEGLPENARSQFSVSACLCIMSAVELTGDKVDCDKVFAICQLPKNVFVIGLQSITLELGTFGEYCIRNECMWACSLFGVDIPAELIQQSEAKGLDKTHLDRFPPNGFYSNDPVDLASCVSGLTTDEAEVMELRHAYEAYLAQLAAEVSGAAEQKTMGEGQEGKDPGEIAELPSEVEEELIAVEDKSVIDIAEVEEKLEMSDNQAKDLAENENENEGDDAASTGLSSVSEEPAKTGYHDGFGKVMSDLQDRIPLAAQLEKMSFLLPQADTFALVSMLSRPDGSMEITAHRICQVVSCWRRTAMAMLRAAFEPPSSDFPRAQDLITEHSALVSGKKRMSAGNINCTSPFEAVSVCVDWITSIHGLPLSVMQGMCVVSRSGGCDPWLEDPKQSGRAARAAYEINELIDLFMTDIPKSMSHEEFLQITFPKNFVEDLRYLDLNLTGIIPVELLRTYMQREEVELTNNQVTMAYWALCRVNEELDTSMGLDRIGGENSVYSALTGGIARPVVDTKFQADPEDYMERFQKDVDIYLESMPTIDTTVIMGHLPTALVPASAHELVTDAMRLDASARNPIPTSCCVWMAQRGVPIEEAMAALTVDEPPSREGNLLITVGPKSFQAKNSKNPFRSSIRAYMELDLIAKYPELCEARASDKHYGPAGNEPIKLQPKTESDHWEELTKRRLGRLDKLLISWRNTMLNEWSTSLYQSRIERYTQRVDIIKHCVGVYHNQYGNLRDSIVSERHSLISRFEGIEADLVALIQDDYSFFSYHTSFLERALRRYEGQFDRMMTILCDIMTQFQRHSGSIKRRGIGRILAASDKLQADLELSCNGLIVGFTAGYAQGFFDELIHRGEVWRKILTDVQGQLILQKENFLTVKDEIDRDITIQVTDRLTISRNFSKGHLELLSEDTAKMLDTVATTRANYAAVQKDANARLVLRIEKAVRESRKLRVAAEQQAELEEPVMRDIRIVLNEARRQCLDIVAQIKDTCFKQLWSIKPLRTPHQEKMEGRIRSLENHWREVELTLTPMIDDYEREVFKQLSLVKSHCGEIIGEYRDRELRALHEAYRSEREAMIKAFRKHFREYDLSESAIFERFNQEVQDTFDEMNVLWGPSHPKFLMQGIRELEAIAAESIDSAMTDIISNMYTPVQKETNDDYVMSRVEVADCFAFSLSKCCDSAQKIPEQFLLEKKTQLREVEEVSMTRNGDMIRPQVKAVLDLLCSGIEIDTDFDKGYGSLQEATKTKSTDCENELNDFVTRYTDPANPQSIGYSAFLTRDRVHRRRVEVEALLDASKAHLIADNSRLDVLFVAGEKDIEEWSSLTLQLIENAFHNAEQSFLSNLWPTPPTTPRLELIPEDEDRVSKLKALLNATNEQTLALGSMTSDNNAALLLTGPDATNESALTLYEDDDDDEDVAKYAEKQAKKAAKKAEKARKREEKERAAQGLPPSSDDGMSVLKADETRELQEGWFECRTGEGYKYFFKPETGESLWDLPNDLKVPKHLDDDLSTVKLETPRDLLMDDSTHASASVVVPFRVVPEEFSLKLSMDPKVIMTEVNEEARAIASLAVETALDITAVIRGRKGMGEGTIASLLGDRYNPALFQPSPRSDEDDQALVLYQGEEPNVQEVLEELGMGYPSETDPVLLALEGEEREGPHPAQHESQKWLQLGLGPTQGDREEDSSDGEDYTGYKEEQVKRQQEQRYMEGRERDQMAREDEAAIEFENYVEDSNCRAFFGMFSSLLDNGSATEEDKNKLLELSALIKPINVVDMLDRMRSSWKQLDEIIEQTRLRQIQREEQAARLRTEEGLQRQQTILEHAEDIDDMAEFFYHKGGLSRVTAKRVSTDCVLKNISTPKKLAKIWNRDHIDLRDFDIDADDIEELEAALTTLLMNGASMNQGSSFVSGPPSPMLALTDGVVSHSGSINLGLDPNYVTQVEEEGFEEEEESLKYGDRNSFNTSMENLRRVRSSLKFSLTKDGYKSFHNGWVEGLSDTGEVYYYNTKTGASSWALPEEDENEVEAENEEEEIKVLDMYVHPVSVYEPSNEFEHTLQLTEHASEDHGHYYPPEEYAQYYPAEQYYEGSVGAPHPAPAREYSLPAMSSPSKHEPAQPAYPDYPQDSALVVVEGDGTWGLEDALGEGQVSHYSHEQQFYEEEQWYKPRVLPVPVKMEVATYSKHEGVARQLELLNAQDRWQNALVQCQHFITGQKQKFVETRAEMFEKVSRRVDTRLSSFVEDIKFMQKGLKKELGESNSTERDLRRLFEQRNEQVIQAEKLSFILESLEKLKSTVHERYESAFNQIEKFSLDWEMIKTELIQVGDVFDEGVSANLEQCRQGCEHAAKLFAYDQLKLNAEVKRQQTKILRKAFRKALFSDTLEEEETRAKTYKEHENYYYERERLRYQLLQEFNLDGWDETIENELENMGYPAIEPEVEGAPEEEFVMSYLLTQIDMEHSLADDYDSITNATKTMALEMQTDIKNFDKNEKQVMKEDGSWYNKHRETLERHEHALLTTLTKVRNRMNEGYQLLNSRLEELDFEVEHAAEAELHQESSILTNN